MAQLSSGTIVMLILILVTLGIITGAFLVIEQSINAESAKNACRLSIQRVLFSNPTEYDATKHLSPFQLECPRRIIEVSPTKSVVFGVEQFERVARDNQYNYRVRENDRVIAKSIQQNDFQEDLAEAIAYEMTECWDMFSRGNQDPLKNSYWAAVPADTCFICAEFHFKEVNIQQYELQEFDTQLNSVVDNKKHYLLTEDAKRYPTYADILYGAPSQANPRVCEQNGFVGSQDVTVQEPLAVVYYKHGADEATFGDSCQAIAVTKISDLPNECMTII